MPESQDHPEKRWIGKYWLGKTKDLLSQRFVKNIP
jgi:hypothetical protein